MTGELKMKILNTKNIGQDSLKILVYGESGSGKTSLAKTIKEPTLIISAESGLLSLRGSEIDVIDLTTDDSGQPIAKDKRILKLSEVYKFLTTKEAREKYKWIFIDSLTEISENVMEALNVEFPDRKDSLVMFGENFKRMRAIVKSFRDLPGYNVVFTALSATDKDENSVRFLGPLLTGKISTQLPAYLDEVYYMHVQKNDDGSLSRLLVTEKSDKLVAKSRSGSLNKLEQPSLSAIAQKIRG